MLKLRSLCSAVQGTLEQEHCPKFVTIQVVSTGMEAVPLAGTSYSACRWQQATRLILFQPEALRPTACTPQNS